MRWDYPNLAIEYDRQANALYIYVQEGTGAEESKHMLEDTFNVDFGPDGNVVGVEVFL